MIDGTLHYITYCNVISILFSFKNMFPLNYNIVSIMILIHSHYNVISIMISIKLHIIMCSVKISTILPCYIMM